jgi:hypothetical protein
MARTLWRWSKRWARPVDNGRVGCELRDGDAEVDECAECRWLLEIRQDGPDQFVLCRPDAARLGTKQLGA